MYEINRGGTGQAGRDKQKKKSETKKISLYTVKY